MARDQRFTNTNANVGADMLARKPVKKSDITKVRTNYNIPTTFKPKGMSDKGIYDYSVSKIIQWWKKNKSDKAAADKAAAGASGGPAPGGGGSGGGSAPGSGGSGAAPAPVTTGTTTGGAKAGEGAGAKPAATVPKAPAPVGAKPAATVPKDGPQGTSATLAALSAAGLNVPLSSVPAAARVSAAALRAWIATKKPVTAGAGAGARVAPPKPAAPVGVIAKPKPAPPKPAPRQPLRRY